MKKLRYQVQKFKILDTYIHTIHSILTPKQLSHQTGSNNLSSRSISRSIHHKIIDTLDA